jgi:Xaa-Pro aminopeptidase
MNLYDERISVLQEHMRKDGLKAYIIPATDPHMSEESAGRYTKERFFFCSFKGNDGTLLVTQDASYLYTDGRYWTQAEGDLKGTSTVLVYAGKAGVPSMSQFVKENNLYPLGLDAALFSFNDLKNFYIDTDHKIRQVSYTYLVKDLPSLPTNKIWKVDKSLLSTTMEERINLAMDVVTKQGCKALVIPTLDDISYVLGYRGSDIACTPVFYSYLYIGEDRKPNLFIDEVKFPSEGMPDSIVVHPYEEFFSFLKEHQDVPTFVDKNTTNGRICSILKNKHFGNNPTIRQKSIKGEVEIQNTKEIQAIDGIAVLKLMKFIDDNVEDGNLDEYICAKYIDDARRSQKRCFDLSFETIAAVDDNAAMMHYAPSKDTHASLDKEKNMLLLVDSGGQYYGGTTDTTRTFLFGNHISEEVKIDYTMTLKSQISLSTTIFEKGCSGHEIDITAREIMWKKGLDYKCGTGHGVGYMSCVHEGPIGFRYYHREGVYDDGILTPGHIITIEPGVYKAHKHGIRLENNLLVVPAFETEDGIFYKFETITYAPYDSRGIVLSMLTDEELTWLNEYNKMVYKKLSPLIEEKDLLEYLKKVCAPLSR